MKIKYLFISLILLISTIIISRDLFKPGYFSIHDDLQVGRQYQMDLCFRDGQIPCRWVPDMGYGYGYPLFNYYPPLPFYLGEAIHLVGFSFIDTTKVLFFLGFLVSGFLMFAFSRKLWGDWGGLLSAVLYLYAPYHSVDSYVRGAMNEFWALAFLPGVFWAAYELIDNKSNKWIGVFALFIGLLLLSHNLMAFIFSPAVAIFSLILIWQRRIKIIEMLPKFAVGGLWGLGLAAFFTMPVIFETKLVHVETMLMGYFNFLAHYVPIGQLFFSRFWGYGSSGWLQETGMPFQVGIPHWPLAILVFYLSIINYVAKKISREYLFLISYFILIFLGTSFLIHSRSVFIWNLIEPLKYLQFPWRFLTLVIFSVSVLGGGIIFMIQQLTINNKQLGKFNKSITVGGTAMLIILTMRFNYSFFRAEKVFSMTDNQKLFSAKGWNKLQTDAIFDYLPKSAKFPPAGPAPDKPIILSGDAQVYDIEKGTNWYKFSLKSEKESIVQVPLYNYPIWQATVNKEKTKITESGDLGLITLTVNPGESNIELLLRDTLIRRFSNLISLLTWTMLTVFLFRQYSTKRVLFK